jgi:hypothetical protein
LSDTAKLLEIPAGSVADIAAAMPFASYGQGSGIGHSIQDGARGGDHRGKRVDARGPLGDRREQCADRGAKQILAPDLAAFLASAMRSVVQEGTARRAMKGEAVSVAGKTGTAQLDEGCRTPGSRDLLLMMAIERRASRLRWWWSTADTAERRRRRSRARSWMPRRSWG